VVDAPPAAPATKVYAGGDCINGGKEVVNAAADGERRPGDARGLAAFEEAA
jgi:NADPH-dependent glutamate synthase beta subunit-like oxidoreductase